MPLPSGPFGRVVADGINYQITLEDIVWFAMAIAHEDPHAPELPAWCMVQRFVAHAQRGVANRNNWSKHIRQFSQPVNPIWAYPRTNEENIARRLGGNMSAWTNKANRRWRQGQVRDRVINDRRRRISTILDCLSSVNSDRGNQIWEDHFPANGRLAAVEICMGRVRNPIPGFTDFAWSEQLEASARRGTHRGHRAIQIGGGVDEQGDYLRGSGRRNIYLYQSPGVRGSTVRIISRDSNSDSASSHNFPRTGRSRRTTRTRVSINGVDLEQPSEESLEGIAGSGNTVSQFASRDTIPEAGLGYLERYIIRSEEDIESDLNDWADTIQESLTELDP